MGSRRRLFCWTSEEIIDLSLQEDTILLKESSWVFISLCFLSHFSELATKLVLSHANIHRLSSRAVRPLTHISRLDVSSRRYENNTHLLLFYYTVSTRLDSLWLYRRQIGGDSDTATAAYWRVELMGAAPPCCRSHFLSTTRSCSFFFLLSFSFWFPLSSGAPLSDRQVSGNFKMANRDLSALTLKKRWNGFWREGAGPHGYRRYRLGRKTRNKEGK